MRSKLPFLLISVGLCLPALGYAHGGGLDSCGGHHDRKRGGYHVHRMANYCACYPEEAICKDAATGSQRYGKPKR